MLTNSVFLIHSKIAKNTYCYDFCGFWIILIIRSEATNETNKNGNNIIIKSEEFIFPNDKNKAKLLQQLF